MRKVALLALILIILFLTVNTVQAQTEDGQDHVVVVTFINGAVLECDLEDEPEQVDAPVIKFGPSGLSVTGWRSACYTPFPYMLISSIQIDGTGYIVAPSLMFFTPMLAREQVAEGYEGN